MKKEHRYFVYILASEKNGTLYIGVTNGLMKRTFQHKLKESNNSFTSKYKVDKLVYYESYQYVEEAIKREKQLKKWNRSWKIRLIKEENLEWIDYFEEMI